MLIVQRMQASEAAKTEEWDQRMRLGNQYRGLHDEEYHFLSERSREKIEREHKIREADNAELLNYREWVRGFASRSSDRAQAAKTTSPDTTLPTATGSTQRRIPPKAIKKDVKSMLKGVVVKKKPKENAPRTKEESAPRTLNGDGTGGDAAGGGSKRPAESHGDRDKRLKLDV